MDLLPHQQRVVEEKKELDEKYEKLFKFIHGEQFHVVCNQPEQDRLIRQLNAMLLYSGVLYERIAVFSN